MRPATSGMKKGAFGPIVFHIKPPMYGAGSDISPKLVENSPKATPRIFKGTTFEISELYEGLINEPPIPYRIDITAKWAYVFPKRKTKAPAAKKR